MDLVKVPKPKQRLQVMRDDEWKLYGTKVPRSIWALNSNPIAWPMVPISVYLKPQSEPTQTTGPSFVTWSLLGKPFPNNKERIMSKHTIHSMPDSAEGNTVAGHACWS